MSKYKKIYNKFIWFLNIKSVYGFVSLVGLILRVALLPLIIPEPFQALAEKFITQFGFPPVLYQILLRLILAIIDLLSLSHIFHFAAFVSAGNSYKKYSEPAIGSVCYTIYYSLYFIMASLIVRYFYWWVILIVFVAYILACWGIYALCICFDIIPDNITARLIAQCVLAVFVFAALITIYCVCK